MYVCSLCELALHTSARPRPATINVSQLSVPVFSLATINEDGSTNMNIVTYASPVGIEPERLWMISLYKVWSVDQHSFEPGTPLPFCETMLSIDPHEIDADC